MSKTNFDDIELETAGIEAAEINSESATAGQVLTADGAGGAGWAGVVDGGPGYLEYVALLSQSGTDAPVASVVENTLGGTVVWTRDGPGSYLGTLSGAFPVGKTVVFAQATLGSKPVSASVDGSGNAVGITTSSVDEVGWYGMTDGGLEGAGVMVRVYP